MKRRLALLTVAILGTVSAFGFGAPRIAHAAGGVCYTEPTKTASVPWIGNTRLEVVLALVDYDIAGCGTEYGAFYFAIGATVENGEKTIHAAPDNHSGPSIRYWQNGVYAGDFGGPWRPATGDVSTVHFYTPVDYSVPPPYFPWQGDDYLASIEDSIGDDVGLPYLNF